jgi:hypothetical protein
MIFITGDTHGRNDIRKLYPGTWKQGKLLNKNDYLIIVGDFGVLWWEYPDDLEMALRQWYQEQPWTTLFIDGNHENMPRLLNLHTVRKFGSTVGKINDSLFYLRRGHIYTIEHKKIFCFGGAQSIDKVSRNEGISWWPEEQGSFKEQTYGLIQLEEANYDVDYIITHTGPASMVDELDRLLALKFTLANPNLKNPITTMGFEPNDNTAKFLEEIRQNTKFKKWYFGHFHCDIEGTGFRALYQDIVQLE